MRQANGKHGASSNGRGTGVDDRWPGHDHGDLADRSGHDHGHGEQRLDVEKLDCFRVAIEFQVLAAGLLPKGCGALRD
ncbi:MAG: hypothetical protein AB7O37_15190 [Vicinamibacteria bacterium]